MIKYKAEIYSSHDAAKRFPCKKCGCTLMFAEERKMGKAKEGKWEVECYGCGRKMRYDLVEDWQDWFEEEKNGN